MINGIRTKILKGKKPVRILLNGKNLIITGMNGSGKTRLVEAIFNSLSATIVQNDFRSGEELKQEIIRLENARSTMPLSERMSHQYRQISNLNGLISKRNEIDIDLFRIGYELDDINDYLKDNVFLFFPAFRTSSFSPVVAVRSLNDIKRHGGQILSHTNAYKEFYQKSSVFEEYLLALKNAKLHYLYNDNNTQRARIIDIWFKKLQFDLRELFEDDTLKLEHNIEDGCFYISQQGKDSFRLHNLSSGYSAIMSIYAELLMSIEAKEVSPEDLNGIVIIDEIDAHLHISIQKKILGFLTRSFPRVQFIVTTHSPFVVMSVDNTIIYDISKREQVENLSSYSYESVAKGLFGITPVSDLVIDKISQLDSLVNDEDPDLYKIESILKDIAPHENKLDEFALYFYQRLVIKYKKIKGGK